MILSQPLPRKSPHAYSVLMLAEIREGSFVVVLARQMVGIVGSHRGGCFSCIPRFGGRQALVPPQEEIGRKI